MVGRHVPALPIAGSQWRQRRWLVLAPHADDETLGAGALIAQTVAAGCLAGVVYLTDGSGSHPAREGRVGQLVAMRRREATSALRRLSGGKPLSPIFLGWKDAHPETAGGKTFGQSCRRLAALCVRLRVDVLATTAADEPHCDHAAAADLAQAVQSLSRNRIRIAEYVVWGAAPSARSHRALVSAPILPGKRRHALAAHRSQLTASLGVGFRLPKDKRAMATRDLLYVRKR
ncbi:MAG: PIG-L family deacetylase [Sphingobium sp.]